MAVVYNNYLTQAKKYYEEARKKAKEDQNKIFDEQVSVVNDTYGKAINDAKIDYEDMHRENAIQKLINENEVAEDMANMGLEGSGLNRTQATAVQLSYANNRSSIERQKQAQVDSIAQKLAQELSTIKQNRIATISAIDKEYDSAAVSAAQDAYKEALDAETARIKSYNSGGGGNNTNVISANGAPLNRAFKNGGSLKDNGVTVTYHKDEYGNLTKTDYYDTITGKKTTVEATVNPYTFTNNAVKSGGNNKLVDAGNAFGYFNNGYQPRGVDGKTKLTLADSKAFPINGNTQNVFKGGNKYYVWDGAYNEYFEVKKVSSGNGTYTWKQVT